MSPAPDDRQVLSTLLQALAEQSPIAASAPDDETLRAYLAGEMSKHDAERIRSWAAAHPEEASRLLEMAPFVAATGPSDEVADLAVRRAWRDFEQRRAEEIPQQRPLAGAWRQRWLALAAAVFFLATCSLALQVWQLRQTARRPIGNLQTVELLGDARAGNTVKTVSIVPGQPFRLALYPAAPPAGCAAYRATLRVPAGPLLADLRDLQPDARGCLSLLLPGELGPRSLELTACDQPRGSFRFDLTAP